MIKKAIKTQKQTSESKHFKIKRQKKGNLLIIAVIHFFWFPSKLNQIYPSVYLNFLVFNTSTTQSKVAVTQESLPPTPMRYIFIKQWKQQQLHWPCPFGLLSLLQTRKKVFLRVNIPFGTRVFLQYSIYHPNFFI